ncbi:MAG: hypothetical protein ACREXQ_01745 [Polaromonas sp.]
MIAIFLEGSPRRNLRPDHKPKIGKTRQRKAGPGDLAMEANEFYLEKHLDKDASAPLILGISLRSGTLNSYLYISDTFVILDRLFKDPLESASPKKIRDNPNPLPNPATSNKGQHPQGMPWFDGDPIKACLASPARHA